MKVLKIVGIIVVVVVVILIALPFLINVNSFRPKIESELSTALGRDVKIGNLKLSLITGSVSADDLSIGDDPAFSQSPFVKAKALDVGVEVMPLIFSKTLHVRNLTLEQPQVTLIRNPSGKWNFSSIGNATAKQSPGATAPKSQPSPSPAPQAQGAGQANGEAKRDQSFEQNLSVGKLQIKDGQVSIGDTSAPGKLHSYKNVNATVSDFSFSSQFPFDLSADLPGGGTAKVDGKAGPVNSEDASMTPLDAKINVKQLNIAASGFVEPASGYAGVADFDGTVSSDGHQAKSGGNANVTNLKLSPKGSPANRPVQLKYAVVHNLANQSGDVSQCDLNMGGAVAHLTGAYKMQGSTTNLNMKLNAQGMPVNDLEAMLPALGVVLPSGSSLQGGTLSALLAISGAADNPVVTGPIKLENTKLAGFNLGSKLSAASALTGINTGNDTSIQNLSTDVHVAPAGIQTQNVNLNVPAFGLVTGSGTISPGGALNYNLVASVNPSIVGGISQLAGIKGTSASIPITVSGTTSDPKIMPDLKAMVKGQLKNQLGNQLKSLTGQQGQNQQGNSVVDSISGLFGKKKK